MARKFQELIDAMPAEWRARYAAGAERRRKERRIEEMRLGELRRALRLSQQTLARHLKTDQAQISRLEQRADLLVSTLRRYVEALGAQLEIVATFPDGATIRIENLAELRPQKAAQPRRALGAKMTRKKSAGVA